MSNEKYLDNFFKESFIEVFGYLSKFTGLLMGIDYILNPTPDSESVVNLCGLGCLLYALGDKGVNWVCDSRLKREFSSLMLNEKLSKLEKSLGGKK